MCHMLKKKDVNDIKIPLRMKIKDSLGTEQNIIK